MTIEKQMTMAFMDGGMVSDNVSVDPVSGNEVPLGSSAEEVRDDVDIKVSKGEFIIPADAVQFIGVDKLEKMIVKAKEGLSEMASNGRMGQPVPKEAEGQEEELPLSDEEIASLISEEAGSEEGFAEGGFVSSSSAIENKPYINAQGTRRTILFINGRPIQAIPEGFTPSTEEAENAVTGGQARTTQDLGTGVNSKWGDGDGPDDEEEREPEKLIKDYTNEELKDFVDQAPFTKNLGRALAVSVPGPGIVIGGMMNKVYNSRAKEVSKEITSRLEGGDQDEGGHLSSSIEKLEERRKRKKRGIAGSLLPEDGLLGSLLPENGLFGGSDDDDEDDDKGLISGLTDFFKSFNSKDDKTTTTTTAPQSTSVASNMSEKDIENGFSQGGFVTKRKTKKR